jgi:hypothetical protein
MDNILTYKINVPPAHSRHSPSFPVRWSKAHRLGVYCVVVLSQQIRTDKKTNTIK